MASYRREGGEGDQVMQYIAKPDKPSRDTTISSITPM